MISQSLKDADMLKLRPMKRLTAFAVISVSLAFAQTSPPAAPATIAISGDIPKPLTITASDLAAMPREKATVPEQDGTQVEYEGVTLREILKRAGALGDKLRGKALSTYILAKAKDGYQVVFTLGEIDAEFGNELILVADKRDGKTLFG